MSKRLRKLRRENKCALEPLSTASTVLIADITDYIRNAPVRPFDQELARRDMIRMLADAEARGEPPEAVIGADYRLMCDEIISAFPPPSGRYQLLALLRGCGVCARCPAAPACHVCICWMAVADSQRRASPLFLHALFCPALDHRPALPQAVCQLHPEQPQSTCPAHTWASGVTTFWISLSAMCSAPCCSSCPPRRSSHWPLCSSASMACCMPRLTDRKTPRSYAGRFCRILLFLRQQGILDSAR